VLDIRPFTVSCHWSCALPKQARQRPGRKLRV
jgi:hypothetical protein